MKILYCVRLFSGMQSSLQSGVWTPTGVPTIFKMVEALDRGPDRLRVLFVDKDAGGPFAGIGRAERPLKGLATVPRLFGGRPHRTDFWRKISFIHRELLHIFYALSEFYRFRPDLVYLDHANVLLGGVLARLTRRPVVFRIMGVYPVMRQALDSRRPILRLFRWCYRAPYALAVCTQDGSGVEPWLDRALDRRVPRRLLINGFDPAPATDAVDARLRLPADRTTVMFLGKLEPAKGIVPFIDAMIAASRTQPGRLYGLVVGAGSQRESQIARVAAAGLADDFTFIGRLPHPQVASALRQADIYVSLNRLGNLSNANLEAMCAGCCMIIPRAQPDIGVDVATEEILPPDAALRIASADDVDGLTQAILRLSNAPQERQAMGEKAAAAARRHIGTWDERVNTEIRLLREIAERHGN